MHPAQTSRPAPAPTVTTSVRHAVDAEILAETHHVDPDGSCVEQTEWRAPAGWRPVPAQRHPEQERHEVIDGLVRVVVEGAGRTYRPGESVIVAPDQEHRLEPVEGHGIHACLSRWSLRRRPPPAT